ncbi:OmpA family protein [Maribacter luteus]|uniref:OmpA family protein n=1 Tax=Maribacter luteus TaxID=2594478 RepID=UPI00249008A5|nr:OmpA family protein [Maribacter luteus]
MGDNIEKIGLANPNDNNILYNKGVKFPSYIKVKADCEIQIKAFKNAGAKFRPKWIAKPREKGPFSSKDMNGHTGDIMGAKVEAKYCGPQKYHIEAFADDPINREPNRIIVQGQAPQKITKAEWRKSKTGSSLGSSPNKFGDDIWLHLETEGLNGAKLNISVFNEQYGGDGYVTNYTAKCYGGEVNLFIQDTYKWRAGTGWITSNSEEFYVKIKVIGKSYYVADKSGDHKIAQHVVFKDKITKKSTKKSTSDLPVKIDENEIDLERYEPCRFKKITVIDEGETIELFEEGKLKIDEDHKKDFAVSEKIYFDFEKWNIKPGAKEVLDGIATFLLDSPFVPVTLGAHCDSRGTNEYNDKLSNNRAIAAVDYLVGKGVSRTRITARGYGKRKPYIKGNNLSEAEHQLNRRVTIQFNIHGGDAESIIFNTIAPDKSLEKEIVLKVDDYKVNKCLRRELSDKHDDKVHVVESIKGIKSEAKAYPKGNVNHKVYSDSTRFKLSPFDFILPHTAVPNQFLYYINSCRYYSDRKKATVVAYVYPDIKWTLLFFLNLTNELSVKWQNFSAKEHKEMQSKAGKIGAEKRWKQKDASIGFSLDAEWNKMSANNYQTKTSLKAQYESKFKKLYDIFGGLGDISKAITSKTKGNVRNIGFKNTPISFVVQPPNLNIEGVWYLKRAVKNKKQTFNLGTQVEITFMAKPLIGLEMTVDLIGAAVGAAAGAISGGAASPGAMRIYNTIKDKLNTGIDLGDDDVGLKADLDIFVDLVISSVITTDIGFSYNTAGDFDPEVKLELRNKLSVELKAGVIVKGEIALVVVSVKGYFKAEASGKASITFGHGINYEQNSLYYQPQLGFDGLNAEYIVVASAGLSLKKGIIDDIEIDQEKSITIAEGDFPEIIPPFDVIKSIEDLSGVSSKIPLIQK